EIHAGFVGSRPQVFNRDFDDINVNVGLLVLQVAVDDLVFLPGLGNAVGELPIRKKQRLTEVVTDGVAVTAVVKATELAEKILNLSVLGVIGKTVVVDGLGAANVADPDYQRLEILNDSCGLDIGINQSSGDQGQNEDDDF